MGCNHNASIAETSFRQSYYAEETTLGIKSRDFLGKTVKMD